MQVETYMEEEIKALVFNTEEGAEWKKKCEELGLTGQMKMTEGGKSPIPFRPMTREEIGVYRCCFSDHQKVTEFSKEAIPLRVLSVLALAQQEQYFTKIEVWSDPSGDDPVLVGVIVKPGPDEHYLLARWGRALVSFAELKAEAVKKTVEKIKKKAKEQIAQGEAWLKDPEIFAVDNFSQMFTSF